ncbi:MAG TPA: GcrA family cell cycle regulator [Aestuariivirgaceae bacterium]|nr:GcrA family cell cycle regulator [Aestuariivirgaceae bacterium]
MNWTEERVALLRRLWTEDFSASRIAAELGGVSRSAVIGKMHRLGLCGRGQPTVSAKRQSKPRLPRSERQACLTVGNTALKMRPEMLEEAQFQPSESIVVPIARKLTIDKLTEHTCKWPIGDPGHQEFHFCGHDSLDAMPYCRYHARLAYRGHGSRSTG